MLRRRMRILFNGFQQGYLFPVLQRVVAETNASLCAVIDTEQREIAVPTVLRHDYSRIVFGDYPVPQHDLAPLDEVLLKRMASCETVSLRMMDRLLNLAPQRFSGSYAERKRLYLRHLRYWDDFIARNGIELFVSLNIPHEVHDYVAFEVCKQRGVRTLMFYQSHIPDVSFILDDDKAPPPALTARLRSAPPVSDDDSILDEHFEAYWRQYTDRACEPVHWFMTKLDEENRVAARLANRLQAAGSRVWRASRRYLPLALARSEARADLAEQIGNFGFTRQRLRHEARAQAEYASLAVAPDLGRPFVYFPLHFQPECTTSPMGGAFVDQWVAISLLAALLPSDWAIYVKEHPLRSRGRTVEFYRDLAAIPSVRLVPSDVSTFSLMSHAIAVATVTGTAGWEALFYGKPVFLFGNVYFQEAPGVVRIKSVEDARGAIAGLARSGPSDAKPLRRYLRAIQDSCIRAYSDDVYAAVSKLSVAENAERLGEALVKAIHGLQKP